MLQKTVVKRITPHQFTDINRNNFLGCKKKERFELAIANPGAAKLQVSPGSPVCSMKGTICALHMIDASTFYYGDFSRIVMGDYDNPNMRTKIFHTSNWVFDIAVDFKGRIIVAEGFGFVRIIENRKNVITLEQRALASRRR